MRILFLSKEIPYKGGPYAWKASLIKALNKEKNIKAEELCSNGWTLLSKGLFGGIKKIREADVVQLYISNIGILAFALVARILGKKVAYICHGNFFTEWRSKKGLRGPYLLIRYWLLPVLATNLVFPSSFLKKKMVGKIDAKKMKNAKVIFNGVDFSELEKQKPLDRKKAGLGRKDKMFLTVTLFRYFEKCAPIPVLARAFAKFSAKHKNAKLWILGDGAFKQQIEEKSRHKKISFLGFKENPVSYMKASTAIVYISGLDNMPLSILEAMHCKKPITASRVGGIPEISKKIILVQNSEKSILEGLERIWGAKRTIYPELKGLSSRARAKNFVKFYKKILSG